MSIKYVVNFSLTSVLLFYSQLKEGFYLTKYKFVLNKVL